MFNEETRRALGPSDRGDVVAFASSEDLFSCPWWGRKLTALSAEHGEERSPSRATDQ